MIEVKRPSHESLFPVGSIWWGIGPETPQYTLYGLYHIYENEDTGEFVEIWVPLKEMPKDD